MLVETVKVSSNDFATLKLDKYNFSKTLIENFDCHIYGQLVFYRR